MTPYRYVRRLVAVVTPGYTGAGVAVGAVAGAAVGAAATSAAYAAATTNCYPPPLLLSACVLAVCSEYIARSLSGG